MAKCLIGNSVILIPVLTIAETVTYNLKKTEPTWKISQREILKSFSFLQSEFGFPKFEKKWIRDEYYISTRKNNIEFSTCIYEIDWNSPCIGIVNHAEPIEFKTKMFPTNFYLIDDLDQTNRLKEIAKQGRDYIPIYIEECAELLKEKKKILLGITTDFIAE